MDVSATFIANLQPTIAIEPSQGPLRYRAVPAQPLAGIDPSPCDARGDASLAQSPAASREIIGLIGVQLVRSLSRPTLRTFDGSNRPSSLPASSSHGRWPRGASPSAGFPVGRPQHRASSPICRDPLDSARCLRPPKGPVRWLNQARPATRRLGRRLPAGLVAPGAPCATRPLPASRANVASK